MSKREKRDELLAQEADFAVQMALVQEGWTLWPVNTSPEEQREILFHFIQTGQGEWYPPGYVAPQSITGDELQVLYERAYEQREERTRRVWD